MLKGVLAKIRRKLASINRPMAVGLVGVTISFLAGSMLFASSIPLLGLSDTSLHLDYSWQVYKRQLPEFYEGALAPIPVSQPPVHFVSQHPPLYYFMLSYFVGPLIDSGLWRKAVAAGTMLTIFIGLMSVYVFSWAGWVYGKRYKKVFAIAVPAILASLSPLIMVSGAIFNDALALLFSSIALVLMAIVIKKGINIRYVLLLSVVALLGMASRASFVSVLIVLLLTIPLAVFLHNRDSYSHKLKLTILYNALLLSIVALGVGWFYLRNVQLSGSWTQTAPSGWAGDILGRQYKSFRDVLTSENFLLLIPKGLYGKPAVDSSYSLSQIASVLVFVFGVATTVIVAAKNHLWRKLSQYDKAIYLLLVLHVGLMIGQQIVHAEGYGGYSMRYVLPIWIPLGLVIAYAALCIKKARGMIVVFIASIGWISLVATILDFLHSRWSTLGQSKQGLDLIEHFVSNVNGLPEAVVPVTLTAIILGLLMQGYALWTLSSKPEHSLVCDKIRVQ